MTENSEFAAYMYFNFPQNLFAHWELTTGLGIMSRPPLNARERWPGLLGDGGITCHLLKLVVPKGPF